MKKYTILLIIFILLCSWVLLFFKKQYKNTQEDSIWQENISSLSWFDTKLCSWIKYIYERWMFDSEIQKCNTDNWETYFMIQRYGIEWWSWKDFFDIWWNQIGSISQYGASDWTIPDQPTIEWKILSWSCTMVDLKSCWIIDLSNSYRGKSWLLKESEYAKTCKTTLKKLWLEPPEEFTETFFELGNRYFMCTDDKIIFYLSFTGNKIGDDGSAEYNNYDTIELYSMQWKTLWLAKEFWFKQNTNPFLWINIIQEISEINSINRCIPMPTYDCYEE